MQLALLRGWALGTAHHPPQQGVRIVLVHAVNPFGFHCGRRFNEDNVDLNRNVLTEDEFTELRAGECSRASERRRLYDRHEWMFNWRGAYIPILDDVRFFAYALYGIGVIGLTHVKRAVVSGQYHRPDGLYFGGTGPAMSRSHQLLLPLLQRVAVPASAGIIVDVHTGLGPSGVDTLIPQFEFAGGRHRGQWEALHAIFGSSRRDCGDSAMEKTHDDGHTLGTNFRISAVSPAEDVGASSGYEHARGTTGAYLGQLGWERSLFLTQEFGTFPGPLVLRGMVIERAEWLFGPGGNGRTATLGCNGTTARGARAVTNMFYVRTASWQRKVIRRGVRVMEQALHALAENREKVPPNVYYAY